MSEINTWPGWECREVLGEGAYGKVYRIEKSENGRTRIAALKVLSIPRDKWEVKNGYENGYFNTENEATTFYSEHISGASREFEVLKELRGNRNIVGYEDHMVIPHEGWPGAEILIRMELLTPLSSYSREHMMSEREIVRLGIDISYALEACHSKTPPILHRDIKPANIMMDRLGNYKLGDFGVARVVEGTRSVHTIAGTEEYMAPEVQKGEAYGESADIYSLGMVLYKLLNGNRGPFLPAEGSITREMRADAKQAILKGGQIPYPANGSPELKQAVRKALSINQRDRWHNASDFRRELEDCLFTCANTESAPADQAPKKLPLSPVEEKQYKDETVYAGAKRAEEPAPNDDRTVYSGAKKAAKPKKKKKWIPVGIAAAAAVCLAVCITVVVMQSQNSAETSAVETTASEPIETLSEEEEPAAENNTSVPISSDLSVGDIITFGSYEQDNNSSDGTEPIEWEVLAVEDGRALVVSKYGLACKPYNEEDEGITWENCTLRAWLNGRFLNAAFSSEEAAMIATTTVTADKNPNYSTSAGDDTQDQVFLLSITEAEKYFSADNDRMCVPTAYAIPRGAYTNSDYTNAAGEACCWWWLRSPGDNCRSAAGVSCGGSVYDDGQSVRYNGGCVRPAMWIRIS